jgi:hypothetical protein
MSWELAYAHDANGNRLAGDKALLAESVRNGQPVRFLIEYGDHVYVTDAQCLWVKSGTVYAQNTSHVSVDFQGALLKFQNDAYWWMIVADTSGNIDMSRWLVGAHTPKNPNSERRPMKWFVG